MYDFKTSLPLSCFCVLYILCFLDKKYNFFHQIVNSVQYTSLHQTHKQNSLHSWCLAIATNQNKTQQKFHFHDRNGH